MKPNNHGKSLALGGLERQDPALALTDVFNQSQTESVAIRSPRLERQRQTLEFVLSHSLSTTTRARASSSKIETAIRTIPNTELKVLSQGSMTSND